MEKTVFRPHRLWPIPFYVPSLLPRLSLCLFIIFFSCKENSNGPDKSIAARIDGESISLNELDLTIQNQLYETLFGVYYTRRIALQELIAEKLLQSEAQARNISKEKLLQTEVQEKKTQAGLEEFISENHLEAGIPDKHNPLRLVSLQREAGRKYLEDAYEKKILEVFVESLKVKHDIETYLEAPTPPKLDLSGLMTHSRGSDSPILTVWVASDFTCPECQRHYEMFELLYKQYKSKVRFNFTHLAPGVTLPSIVAECCADRDKFWEMHDLIFRNAPRDTADFLNLASQLDVDKTQLMQCIWNSADLQKNIAASMSHLAALNVNVTPALIVDGTLYYGEFSFEKISEYIEEIIAKKQAKD